MMRNVPGTLKSTTVDPRRDSFESLRIPPFTTRFKRGHKVSNSWEENKLESR